VDRRGADSLLIRFMALARGPGERELLREERRAGQLEIEGDEGGGKSSREGLKARKDSSDVSDWTDEILAPANSSDLEARLRKGASLVALRATEAYDPVRVREDGADGIRIEEAGLSLTEVKLKEGEYRLLCKLSDSPSVGLRLSAM